MNFISDRPSLRSETERRNEDILSRTKGAIAGGDSSTMRVPSYHIPLVAEHGLGSHVWDADGNEYVDFNMAYGPLILGHRNPAIVDAVTRQLKTGGSQLGFPTRINLRVAEKIKSFFPGMELMRFANSGTEADASAVRLARAVTGRPKLLMFEGHYHGWSEGVFHRYHAPVAMLPDCGFGPAIPGTQGMSAGMPDAVVVRWNDLDALAACLDVHGPEVAAVIMEPIMGNAGVIPPKPGYLEGAQALARQHGALLIFDEVITGLRVAPGGAQELYGVRPDITVISKALGGGFPVAAFGASKEIMAPIAEGAVFHGGVYSSNATVMAAAEAVLDHIEADAEAIYARMYALSDMLAGGLRDIFARAGRPAVVQHVGPMLSLFLTTRETDAIHDYRQARALCDADAYIALQHTLQRAGVYFHPNYFEPMYLSAVHSEKDVAVALDRIDAAAQAMFRA
ncbi:aspartate aminotransferase family protein [Methylocella sp.]|uniref:aspartate aminotransferase family protein n=1 Tax=Methylocella sp. TaxID=1978226 RepID=UPI0037843F58